MKITKAQLKQIIKEELALVLEDSVESSTRSSTRVTNKNGQEKISNRDVEDRTAIDSAGVRTTSRYTDADLQSSGANVGKAPRSIKKSLKMSPTDYHSSEQYQDTGAGTREIDSSAARHAYAGKKRVAQTGRPEDMSKIGAGDSTVTVDGKVLKPGSKRYAAAVNFLDRAETVDAEISDKSTEKPTTAGFDASAYDAGADDEFVRFMKDRP
jgi:hypothetical protein